MNIYSDIYRSFQRVLTNQKRCNIALEIAEQSKMKTFQESCSLINYSHLTTFNHHNMQELIKGIKTTLVYYSVLYDENQFYRFHRFHRLPKGENNVYFYPTEILIWVIQPTGETYCEQVDLTHFWQEEMLSLGGLIRQLNEEKNQEDLEIYQQNLSNLYKLLIKPIAQYLPTNPEEIIAICPQDFLYLLPFSALINERGESLIENHSLITIPSLSLLELASHNQLYHQKNITKSSYFLVGNPSMPHIWLPEEKYPFVLPNLTEGDQEIKTISALFNTTSIQGSYATKNQIIQQIQEANIIHFTTYSLLSELGGFPGSIALSPSMEDQGLLTPEDIAKLNLKGSLVTISHGYRKSSYIWGNSVEKIATAFILAGMENILLALWQNDHPANTLLLKEFYQNLQKNDHKAKALRQAMLTTKKTYPHPLNWAYFSLFGI